MVRRSVLFSPGDEPKMLRKALTTAADVLIFDLEDAVAPETKDAARTRVVDTLSDVDASGSEIWVRINPLDIVGDEDLDAIADVDDHFDGVVVPKVDDGDTVAAVDRRLTDLGSDLSVFPIIETARGAVAADSIASGPRVDGVLFGAEDFSVDVGSTRTKEGTEILYARQRIVTAASAVGVDALDTVYLDLEDEDGLRTDSELGVQFGFDGKLLIHPAQIAVVNDVFSPDEDEIAWASKVVEALEAAEKRGKGVFQVDGQMIDGPLIDRAERILERASAADEE